MRYTRNDIEKLSEGCLSSHRGGTSLMDAILSILQQTSMNPEQVKRLVEMTNTGAFLDKFKETSGDDRFVDFDVLNPSEVISRFLGNDASPIVSSKSKGTSLTITSTPEGTTIRRQTSQDPGLDSDDSWFFDDVAPEKTASFDVVPLDIGITYIPMEKTAFVRQSIPAHEMPFNKWKIEDQIRTKMAEAEQYCDEIATDLASRFNNIYAKEAHENFEKEALATFGPTAVYPLQAIRAKLGMELFKGVPSEEEVKLASDRFISDRTSNGIPEMGYYLANLQSFQKHSEALGSFTKESAVGLGAGMATYAGTQVAQDYLKEITSPLGYMTALKYGPSTFYRVRGPDKIMEDILQRGGEAVWKGGEKMLKKIDTAKDYREYKENRMAAVKSMLKDNPDIAGMDKAHVRSAVDTVSKYAPKLSGDPAFLSGMVASMVHSGTGGSPRIDPQTISEIVKAEKRYRDMDKDSENIWTA